MKIAIATTGRFHVLDLARELHNLGEDVAFYSYVPTGRAQRLGLPMECNRSQLPLVAPLVAWERKAPNFLPDVQLRLMCRAMDAVVAARLEACDILVCMSGIFLKTAETARRKYGAKVVVERGSQHILAQRKILKQLGAPRVPGEFIVERECLSYELADRISVPSSPVVESFRSEAPHLEHKLMVNPYGVDLDLFPQRTASRPAGPSRVLFVGGWSMRKGADTVKEAISAMPGVKLIHIGKVLDLPFPTDDPQFEHIGTVPQWDLGKYYRTADVLVLASREEGLALVQLQALASGLPLVCSSRTGGSDLALTSALNERIVVVPPDNSRALVEALTRTLDPDCHAWKPLSERDRTALSWQAYGKRYQANIQTLTESLD